jgi:hypothetical protein
MADGTPSSVFRLQSYSQSYEWGKLGSQSKVAQYAKATLGDSFSEEKPYAEVLSHSLFYIVLDLRRGCIALDGNAPECTL